MCREYTFLVLIIVLASTSACGKNDGRVKVYPVTGEVLVRGVPADGARVVFYPVSDDLKKPGIPLPAADTDSQGKFKLCSYVPEDGAPAGDYRVSIIWPEALPPDADPDTVEPKDRLGGKYAEPQESQLTAKIEPGSNELRPFELQ